MIELTGGQWVRRRGVWVWTGPRPVDDPHPAPPRPDAAKCGTDSGYYRHKRTTHTEPCNPCRQAHNAAKRRWKQGRRSDAA